MSVRLNHPFRPGVSKSVPDDIAQKWFDNGWTAVEVAPKPKTAKKAAAKPSAK